MGNMTLHAEGNPVCSFVNSAKTPIESLKAYFAPTQSGSGDPSPSNIRPITGWTGCSIYSTGKNLLNQNNYGYKESSMIFFGGGTSSRPDGTLWLPMGTYTFSATETMSAVFATDENSRQLAFSSNTKTLKFTVPQGQKIRIGCVMSSGANTDTTNYQLELGSTNTPYVPYSGSTIPINWTTEAGTVYGGYVDMTKGEVVAEYNIWHIDEDSDLNLSINNNSAVPICIKSVKGITMADKLKVATDFQSLMNNVYSILSFNGMIGFSLPVEYNTIEKCKQWLLDNSGVDVIVELENPVHYPLTPQQIKTLRGTNNIWSNAYDKVECDYNLHETKAIADAKKRIALNQPHISTVTGNIATFNTDMKAPLKECKVNFSPVQSGSGDPSPNNIRNISGWNKVITQQSNNLKLFIIPTNTTDYEVDGMIMRYLGNGTYIFIDNGISANVTDFYFTIDIEPLQLTPNILYRFYANTTLKKTIGSWDFLISLRDNENKNMLALQFIYNSQEDDFISNGEISNNLSSVYNKIASKVMVIVTKDFIGHTIQLCGVGQYNSNSIDWTSTAGTLYGGYVDLVKGEVVVTHALTTPNVNNWSVVGNNTYQLGHLPGDISGHDIDWYPENILCSHNKWSSSNYIHVNTAGQLMANKSFWTNAGLSTINDSTISAYCADQVNNGTPIQVSYKLLSPITYQLTPTQLKSLRGTNNIWSNTNGNIELAYWSH